MKKKSIKFKTEPFLGRYMFFYLFIFFVSVSRVTSRGMLRSSTINSFFGRKTYKLGALLIVFFQNFQFQKTKKKNRKER